MNKRIIVHDYAGHPFQIELSRALASRGHDVMHIYYGHNNTPKGDLQRRVSDPESLTINPVYTKAPLQKYAYFKRFFQETEYGKGVVQAIRTFKPDVVISANAPLNTQKLIFKAVNKSEARFVFWLQDVLGLASYHLLKEKIPILGYLVGKYYIQLERKMLRASDKIILISEDFAPLVAEWGVDPALLSVIPNWAPLQDMPVEEKSNTWSKTFDLDDKFCFLYTGTLGLKHNSDLLLKLAESFRDHQDVRVVVISEGPGATWLNEKIKDQSIDNLLVLDYQPFEDMPQVLATGDVLTAILEPSAGLFSVPSKVLTYLCAQRAILLAVPVDNLAAKIVAENQAGLIGEPHDPDLFLKSARKLYQDADNRNLCAANARRYADTTFDIEKITDQFERSFSG